MLIKNAGVAIIPRQETEDGEVQGDEFYGPRFYLRGYPRRQRASRAAYNPDSAVRLWQISEQLTGVKYEWKYG